MRIRRVEARAFGPFEGQELELASGMNVVSGPNESGKSTWHGALYAGLCGMRRGRGRARTEDQDFTDSHRPWNLDRWEVAAVVELGDGRTLELRHDLDGKVDSRITDLGTGADVSADYMHDGAPDGAALLGLTRDVLPSTIFVRQADILAVTASGDNLQEQLQRAASTSGQDATAQEALALIESFRSDEVGSTVRHSTKPLRAATVRREQCERELASVREQHEEYLRLLHDAQDAEEAAEHAQRVLGVARALKGREEVAERERRLKRAEELARDLPAERPPPRTGRPTAEEEELRQALSNFKERPEPRPVPEGRSAEAIQRELSSLPEPPSGDTEVHDSVARTFEQWRDRAVALETSRSEKVDEPEQPVEDVDPSELRRLADALEVSLPDVDPDLRRQVEAARATRAKRGLSAPLLIGVALVVAGVLLVVVRQQAVGFVLLAAGAAAVALSNIWKSGSDPDKAAQLEARLTFQEEARRQAEVRRQNSLDRLEALELGDSAQELRRLAQQIDRAEIELSRRKAWEARVRRIANGFQEAEQALRQALVERGIVEAEDSEPQPDDLVEHYKRDCRVRSEQARLASRRPDLESELRTRKSAEEAHEEAARDRAEAQSRLQRAAEAVGISDPDLPQAAETWLKQEEAREERNNTLRERWAELDGVLEGDTVEELREEVDLRKANLPPLEEDWEELGGPELLDRFARIEEEAQEKGRVAAELHGRVSDRGRNLPSVPAAEEAFEKAEQELRRVQRLDGTLERTHEFLSNAREQVQRLISPRLKTAVERRLPAITAGRYTEALVDPDSLEVKVRAPGRDWRPASRLSHGTTEQIYLLLRIGLVEFIATTSEPAPLILDDVTVQCDSVRTEALLEMLHELSLERQIIVFSQEQQVLDWARRELGSERDKLIELNAETIAA